MEVVDVNGVPTHVFSLQTTSRNEALLLVVPGSPGMGHFYVPFATRLFQLGGGAYDVCVVSHAGHSPGTCKRKDELETGVRDFYSLEEQVAHKLAFIEDRASHKESLYLIGHSIGCYMILNMLLKLASSRVKKAILLFPTIEKMSLSPNGRVYRPFLTTLRPAFVSAVWILSYFPEFLKRPLLRYWFYSTPTKHLDSMCQAAVNIDNRSIYNILCMAEQSLNEVKLPAEAVCDNIEKLVFYYGVGDNWTLESCYEDMVKRFPDKDVNLCSSGHSHAFVFTASDEMAEFVCSKLPQNVES